MSNLAMTHPHVAEEWDYEKNTDYPNNVTYGSKKKRYWICANQHSWYAEIKSRTKGSGCPVCRYMPKKNLRQTHPELAKEWASRNEISIESVSAGSDKQVWWQCSLCSHLWKSRISNRTSGHGCSVCARKTLVRQVGSSEAKLFYENHHIQGYKNGNHYGLLSQETHELVALSTWLNRSPTEVSLERYATSNIVQGGFSKLLKHVSRILQKQGIQRIVTFSDNEVSNSALYENSGFTAEKELAPDYQYLYEGHKFGFRKKRFANDPKLLYDENKTERELAIMNNIPRIWDSGKIRWVYFL